MPAPRRRPRLARRTARWPARWPSGRSCCSTPAPRCRCSARAGRPAPRRRRRAVRGRPAHLHGLLLLPQPRAAALPGPRARHRRADRRSTRCAPSCPDVEIVHERGCDVSGDDRSGFAAAVDGGPAAPTCASRSSATSPGLFGRGTSGEGCDAEDLRLPGRPGGPARRAPGHRHARRRGRRLRPPVRARRRRGPGRRSGPGVHARRGGRRGDRRRPVRSGAARAASCPCRSRGTPGGQPGTYLQPPLGARRAPASAASTRRRCSPSGTARRTPPSRSSDLRLERDRGRPRTASSP